jgi:membrane-bound lytic murein transglycosylase A
VPFRSVAVDPSVTPLGSVAYLTATLPDGERWSGLAVAMDSGAAIKGRDRIDLFVGAGERARAIAGSLQARGRIVWLAPRA